jgi:hypothetical protein
MPHVHLKNSYCLELLQIAMLFIPMGTVWAQLLSINAVLNLDGHARSCVSVFLKTKLQEDGIPGMVSDPLPALESGSIPMPELVLDLNGL